jgi:hypothetical protein
VSATSDIIDLPIEDEDDVPRAPAPTKAPVNDAAPAAKRGAAPRAEDRGPLPGLSREEADRIEAEEKAKTAALEAKHAQADEAARRANAATKPERPVAAAAPASAAAPSPAQTKGGDADAPDQQSRVAPTTEEPARPAAGQSEPPASSAPAAAPAPSAKGTAAPAGPASDAADVFAGEAEARAVDHIVKDLYAQKTVEELRRFVEPIKKLSNTPRPDGTESDQAWAKRVYTEVKAKIVGVGAPKS